METAAPDPPLLSKAEQARVNGAKSKGPVTPEGKAKSARNATRHGFSSPRHICLPGEDPAAFNQVHQDLLNAWCPNCPDGTLLVRQLAVAHLQRDRADRMQVPLWAQRADGTLAHAGQLAQVMRYANAADRQIRRCREALLALYQHPLHGTFLVGDLAERIPMDDELPTAVGPDEPLAGEPPLEPLPANQNEAAAFDESMHATPEPQEKLPNEPTESAAARVSAPMDVMWDEPDDAVSPVAAGSAPTPWPSMAGIGEAGPAEAERRPATLQESPPDPAESFARDQAELELAVLERRDRDAQAIYRRLKASYG